MANPTDLQELYDYIDLNGSLDGIDFTNKDISGVDISSLTNSAKNADFSNAYAKMSAKTQESKEIITN